MNTIIAYQFKQSEYLMQQLPLEPFPIFYLREILPLILQYKNTNVIVAKWIIKLK